jgi:hypothetical protein
MITLILHLLEKDGNKIEQRVKFVNISNTVDFCVEKDQIVWNCGKNFSQYSNWDLDYPPIVLQTNTNDNEKLLADEYRLRIVVSYGRFRELHPKQF